MTCLGDTDGDRPAARGGAGARPARRPARSRRCRCPRTAVRCCTSTSASATAATGSGCGRRRLPRRRRASRSRRPRARRPAPGARPARGRRTPPPTPARVSTATSAGWACGHDGRLVACAVMERNGAGRPHLAGITVHPSQRGLGLGLAMTAHLTRLAVGARRGLHARHVRRQRRRPPAVPRPRLRHRPRLVQPPGPRLTPRAAPGPHFVPAARRPDPGRAPGSPSHAARSGSERGSGLRDVGLQRRLRRGVHAGLLALLRR